MPEAPAAAKASTHFHGSDTMRWQSRKALVRLRRHATTGAPKVMLGTKWPSITSTLRRWVHSYQVGS